jgi:hypothetical protein
MRIVKPGALMEPSAGRMGYWYNQDDTIEISDANLNTIFGYFIANEVISAAFVGCGNKLDFVTRGGITFAQYLKSLISLTGEGK